MSDFVCYWFEKARTMIEGGKLKRVGLLATQGIRGGANRKVLDRIKETGDIFFAYADRNWVLNGATVHVSMIGFDDGSEKKRQLNGQIVAAINADLTSAADVTMANRLQENADIAFIGDMKKGQFDIPDSLARQMLLVRVNESGRSNSDVLRPWLNAYDITHRSRNMWIIDFGIDMPESEASLYKQPYEYVKEHVKPERDKVRNPLERSKWWIHGRTAPDMRNAIKGLNRYLITPRVAKHRLFAYVDANTIPDGALVVFAWESDYALGILHSKAHEVWARATGTQLREAESGFRYSQTFTFETFPFPWPPGQEPSEADNPHVLAIAAAARQLDQFRTAWLNPPATQEKTISVAEEKRRNNLTLTNLYNALSLYREQFMGKLRDRVLWAKETKAIITLEQIDELDHIHTTLDHAVLSAYGWPHTLTDEQILERLLALNLERAAHES